MTTETPKLDLGSAILVLTIVNLDILLPTIQMLDASSIGGGAVDIVNYLGDTPAGVQGVCMYRE